MYSETRPLVGDLNSPTIIMAEIYGMEWLDRRGYCFSPQVALRFRPSVLTDHYPNTYPLLSE